MIDALKRLFEGLPPVAASESPGERDHSLADARKDPLEEHMIRKIAGLLHVSHPEFIEAKIRARASAPPRS